MKVLFWVMAAGLSVAMLQYGLFKENGEPRHVPSLQQVLR